MRLAYAVLIALVLMLWVVAVSSAADPVPPDLSGMVDGISTYIGHTDKPVAIAWDKTNDSLITNYEFLAFNLERKAFLIRGNVPQHDTPTVTITPSRTGHYIFYVRSVNQNQTDQAYRYSNWSHSLDANSVSNGQKWWIYVYLSPPGQPVFD